MPHAVLAVSSRGGLGAARLRSELLKGECATELDPKQLGTAGRLLAMGVEFAGMVVAGVMAGYYADAYVGSAPLFTLLLTLGGMMGAMYRLLWSLKQSNSPPDHGS